MNIRLDDIEVADINVVSTMIDSENRVIIIGFPESYYVPGKRWLGQTNITITAWADFTCLKNIYQEETGNTTVIATKKYDEIETFELIQEIAANENVLILGGWSKETGCWLSYEFIDAKVDIDA